MIAILLILLFTIDSKEECLALSNGKSVCKLTLTENKYSICYVNKWKMAFEVDCTIFDNLGGKENK